MVFFIVTSLAKAFQVVPVHGYVFVKDVVRCDMDFMVRYIPDAISVMASLANVKLGFQKSCSVLLPLS